jgi:hypothetical protein
MACPSPLLTRYKRLMKDAFIGRTVDETLATVLHTAFRERMIAVMDQSQHTSADTGGEGAAYEFCQALDTWEKECESLSSDEEGGGGADGLVGSVCDWGGVGEGYEAVVGYQEEACDEHAVTRERRRKGGG